MDKSRIIDIESLSYYKATGTVCNYIISLTSYFDTIGVNIIMNKNIHTHRWSTGIMKGYSMIHKFDEILGVHKIIMSRDIDVVSGTYDYAMASGNDIITDTSLSFELDVLSYSAEEIDGTIDTHTMVTYIIRDIGTYKISDEFRDMRDNEMVNEMVNEQPRGHLYYFESGIMIYMNDTYFVFYDKKNHSVWAARKGRDLFGDTNELYCEIEMAVRSINIDLYKLGISDIVKYMRLSGKSDVSGMYKIK